MKHDIRSAALGLAASLMLAACGGGGGSDAAPQTPDNDTLTLQGTAATGAAIAGAAVDVKCAAGSGSATTATNGNFTVSIEGGSLPCVLRVTPAGGATLHSVAAGSGSVTVNLTPLSELIVAQAAGGDAAALYANFDAAAQAKVATAALATASAAVAAALAGVVDLAGVDPLKDTLVAANGSNAGNALDQKLDALNDALSAARTDLAALNALLLANGERAAAVIATELQPASSQCKGVRSGAYRYINPNESGDWSTHVVTYDAVALTATLQDGTVLQLASDGGCKFSYGPNVLVVSSAGVVIERYLDSTNTARVAMAIPEQTLPLSELAGTWNTIYLTASDAGALFAGGNSVMTMDAAGHVTSALDCNRAQPCTERTSTLGTFSVNADGGFDYVAQSTSRAFAYRNAAGDTMFVILLPSSKGVIVGTRQAALAAPVAETSSYWDITVDAADNVLALSDQATTNTPVGDGVSYTQLRESDGRIVVQTVNQPREGLRYRPESNTGTPAPVFANAIITLPITGMGVAFYIGETVHLYGVSVRKD